ncbi:type II toxin-antitoxin system RelE/ParE family toxin [Zunongwangia sp. F260]|uniref:Toxin n=1 Tax=Autumnicola lenta TaxID=3075593 RepID=A0ABU3CI51_9FLAO|nr:type II toxin-antitoxin system RelE/ParE family toxin [Zunongwangia sp. F260]MDT0646038.1 type II toxin-antitoxin system RelE/ParE family toxin [Zunongwangia sp. F260]
MDQYILSQKSHEDIDDIYDFGADKFGEDQALEYLIGLRTHFEFLLKNPHIGKKRDEIKEGLFSFPYVSHIVFYRVFNNHIRIVRVLHGSRDLKKFLK